MRALFGGRRSTRAAISCPQKIFRPGAARGGRRRVSPERHLRRTENVPGPAGADTQGFRVLRDAGHHGAAAFPSSLLMMPVPFHTPSPPYNRLRRKNPSDTSRRLKAVESYFFFSIFCRIFGDDFLENLSFFFVH